MDIGLHDSNFSHAFTCSNGNLEICPKTFQWNRSGASHEISIFTDNKLEEVLISKSKINIALLLEPPSVKGEQYQPELSIYSKFYLVLSFCRNFCSALKNGSFYALGGTWIEPHDWKLWDKNYNVSLIASSKNQTIGHKFRHLIRDQFSDKIDLVCGRGINPIPYKLQALAPFRYSIIVENGKYDAYFSEKIIDCFLTGTIPIYWGCPSIDEFFISEGLIKFDSIEDLSNILKNISEKDYKKRYEAIELNFHKAIDYSITEDWLYQHVLYPKIIKGW